MALDIPLNQIDINYLKDSKENLQEQNTQISESSTATFVEIGRLLLIDIPFKKKLDSIHVDIYLLEEELRRLNGTSIIQPLQERGISIVNNTTNQARLYINDGRLIITESSVEILNIPIVPMRGYCWSQITSGNFDIWSRNRIGSTTSILHTVSTFTIDDSHKKLKVNIDGVIGEIDFSTMFMMPQVDMEASGVASIIQLLLQELNPTAYTNVSCLFNEDIKAFTLMSGTSGPTSSAVVLDATDSDLKTLLGFDNQYEIVGKYSNNLLNVEIDGTAAEIQISDFRKCFEDTIRGYNNDDAGVYWTGSLDIPLGYYGRDKVGPLLCSGVDNGKEVARSIESQLKMVATGGFKDCMVLYFEDNKTFMIYSGTFGSSSSVRIFPASDSNKDASSLLGLSSPQQLIGNEEFFETLQKLNDKLITLSNLTISNLGDPETWCHSALYTQPTGVNISSDFQTYDLMTTKIYDLGSRGKPRLYPDGKLIIDDTNDKIDFFEDQDIELTATIEHGTYDSPVVVASAIAKVLNDVGTCTYTCIHDSLTKFLTITSDLAGSKIFSILWQSGENALISIGNSIKMDVSADATGAASYISGELLFYSTDFFNPTFISQFDGEPKVIDDSVDELSALLKEQSYLQAENQVTGLLTYIQNATAYDNEVRLNGWESLAALQLAIVEQEYEAIRAHRGAYANHISDSDVQIDNKTIAYNNLKVNRDFLIDALSNHAALLNLTNETSTFIAYSDFTNGGIETFGISVSGLNDKKIYNNPAPLVKYQTQLKHIPGRFSPVGLFSTSAIYTPEQELAFKLTNTRTGTQGYSYTPPDVDGYTVFYDADTAAEVVSNNSGTYDFSAGDTLSMKIDGKSEQIAIFNATPGYTEGRIAVTSQFVIKTGVNDRVDFSEGQTYAETTCSNNENYTLNDNDSIGISIDGSPFQYLVFHTADFVDITQATAQEVVDVLNSSWPWVTASVSGTKIKITHNIIGFHSFQLNDSSGNPNVQFGFSTSLFSGIGIYSVTIPAGVYDGSTLASTIQNLMNLSGDSTYSVDYSATYVLKFAFSSDGAGSTGIFELLWNSGPNVFRSAGYTFGFNTNATGDMLYYSDVQLQFSIVQNVNNDFTMSIDSVMSTTILITQGRYFVSNLISEISTQIANDPSFDNLDFTVTYPANKFRITSTTKGLDSQIQVYEGTNDFLRTVCLDGDAPVYGGGNVGNIDAVTVDEVVSILNSDIIAISASNSFNKVKIKTMSSFGSVSSVEVTGGNCRSIIGFDLIDVRGNDRDNRLKVDIDSDVLQDPIGVATSTSIISGYTMANSISVALQAIVSGGYLNSDCSFNESMIYQDFVNSLKITSGTSSVSSSVSVTDKTIKIIVGFNDAIDFEEVSGVQLSAFISAGFYNPTTLSQEIKSKLEAVGINAYGVSYSLITKKLTITSTGSFFSLLFETGVNFGRSAATTLGFYHLDKTGVLSYSGDGFLKWGSIDTELGFNNQIQVSGHSIVSVKVSITDFVMTAIIYWLDNGGGSRLDLNIDLNTFSDLYSLINKINLFPFYYATCDGAYLLGRVSSPFRINHQDQLIVEVDGISTTITFNAVRATSVSGTNPCTRIFAGVNDRITINLGAGAFEIQLGKQITPEKISAKIQEEVRKQTNANLFIHSAYLGFTCEYVSGKYVLSSGVGGTSSSIVVTNGSINDAAASLKLGVANGGIETLGSGDVVNSNFVTITEVVNKLTGSLIDAIVSGPDYIKIKSSIVGWLTRIKIEDCELKEKFGFDSNDDCFPSAEFSSISCTTIQNIAAVEIQNTDINVIRGWQTNKGNIVISFSSVDDEHIINRLSIITNRLSYLPTREAQINSRATAILGSLTSTNYDARKEKVRVRLNKNTGSYVKIGDKFAQIDNNQNMIDANTDMIDSIDSIL